MKSWTELRPGDKVIAHQPVVKEYIADHYQSKIIGREKSVKW